MQPLEQRRNRFALKKESPASGFAFQGQRVEDTRAFDRSALTPGMRTELRARRCLVGVRVYPTKQNWVSAVVEISTADRC